MKGLWVSEEPDVIMKVIVMGQDQIQEDFVRTFGVCWGTWILIVEQSVVGIFYTKVCRQDLSTDWESSSCSHQNFLHWS